MARYCQSCGSISKTQIRLYCSIFGKISVFVILHCIDIHIYYIYIYTDRHTRSLYRAAHARRGVIKAILLVGTYCSLAGCYSCLKCNHDTKITEW